METSRVNSPIRSAATTSHYSIAKDMVHYQSVDVGVRCEF